VARHRLQLDAESRYYFENRGEAWVAINGKGFVEALPSDARLVRDLGHAAGASYVSEGGRKKGGIFLFKGCLEVVGRIPSVVLTLRISSHQILGERLCRLISRSFSGLVASCEEDDKLGAATREADADIDAGLGSFVAQVLAPGPKGPGLACHHHDSNVSHGIQYIIPRSTLPQA